MCVDNQLLRFQSAGSFCHRYHCNILFLSGACSEATSKAETLRGSAVQNHCSQAQGAAAAVHVGNKARQITWRERTGNLQAVAKLTVETHPDNVFLLFLEGGKDAETIQEAPAKLNGIFEDLAWGQHVLQRIQTANTSATHDNSTEVAEACAMPASRRKTTAETQDADTDKMSVQTQTRCQCRHRQDVSAVSTATPPPLGCGIIGSC